jgi:hypothetical protein
LQLIQRPDRENVLRFAWRADRDVTVGAVIARRENKELVGIIDRT